MLVCLLSLPDSFNLKADEISLEHGPFGAPAGGGNCAPVGHPALLAQCLLNRGHSVPDRISHFLEPRLKHLSDPFLLPDMGLAVDRLFRAREEKESVVVFGDYDVDGVTSTALLLEVLNRLGWRIEYYLPSRMDEGYGLSQEAADNCLRSCPASLLLAVDCGSTAVDCIRSLKERGIDVIVLDHHQPGGSSACRRPRESPRASGGNEWRMDASDFRELCSAGLAFKLAHALVKRGRDLKLPEAVDFDVRPLLDLVALGTIADLVPLTGENRVLVSAGLERAIRPVPVASGSGLRVGSDREREPGVAVKGTKSAMVPSATRSNSGRTSKSGWPRASTPDRV